MKKISSVIFIFLFLINYSQIRDDITYLNGEWEIIYDYNNIGKSESFNTNEGFSKGKIENISKNKKSYIAKALVQIILDKLLVNDKSIN